MHLGKLPLILCLLNVYILIIYLHYHNFLYFFSDFYCFFVKQKNLLQRVDIRQRLIALFLDFSCLEILYRMRPKCFTSLLKYFGKSDKQFYKCLRDVLLLYVFTIWHVLNFDMMFFNKFVLLKCKWFGILYASACA